jgi:hypothetical protein
MGTVWIAESLYRADPLGCGLLDRADCWVAGVAGCWVGDHVRRPDCTNSQSHDWLGGGCGLADVLWFTTVIHNPRHLRNASGYPSFLVREGESSEWKRSHVMYSNTSADNPSSYML